MVDPTRIVALFLLISGLLLAGCDSSGGNDPSGNENEAEATLAGEWESEAAAVNEGDDALKIRFDLTNFGSGESEGSGASVSGTVTAFINTPSLPLRKFDASLKGQYESQQLSLEVTEGADGQRIRRFGADSFDCVINGEDAMQCDLGEVRGDETNLTFARGKLNNTSPSVTGTWSATGNPVGDEVPARLDIAQDDTSLSVSAVGSEGAEFTTNGTYYAPILEITNISNGPTDGEDFNCLVESEDQISCNVLNENSILEEVSLTRADEENFVPVEIVDLACPAELLTGEEGTFTATINEEATKPVAREWAFGDGQEKTGFEVSKAYEQAGTYTATFNASNGQDAEDSESCTVEVTESPSDSGVLFVDADATGNDNGSSWDDAYTHLQDALREAEDSGEIEEIWVAEGTYFPDWRNGETTGNREASFVLIDDVGLYGGFSGDETSRDQRDWSENETVLSGEINISDFPDDNSERVVTGTDTNGILDGFTVTKGGVGMYNDNGRPTVRNTFFIDNQDDGVVNQSGFLDDSGSPDFIDCAFVENGESGMNNIGEDITASVENSVFVGNGGSGVRNSLSTLTVTGSSFRENSSRGINNIEGNVEISNSSFLFNEASRGGAVHNWSEGNDGDFASLTVINTTFIGNSSTFQFRQAGGGAIANRRDGSSAKVISSLFVGNSSAKNGGAINGDVRIVNSTFSGNTAEEQGGAVNGDGDIFSSILWGNSAGEGNQVDGSPFLRSSLIENGLPDDAEDGGGNISTNPLFVDADGPDNTLGTRDDNLRLQSGSPAIDAGTNEALDLDGDGDPTDDVPFDLDGDTRVQNGTVDMGAYEGAHEQ